MADVDHLEVLIAKLYNLSNKFNLDPETYGGSESEYQYAMGKCEAYAFSADLLTQLRGK